ncbi:hypothetical protein PSCICO_49560 [Pseudomonas cichorii]|nr:hypothetical protein PSCICO_49560 [Pseudomonas cichorii]
MTKTPTMEVSKRHILKIEKTATLFPHELDSNLAETTNPIVARSKATPLMAWSITV